MARHSSPEQWPFYRSVIAWFLPWLLLAGVAGTAVWIAVDALGRDELQTKAPAAVATSPSPERERKSPKPKTTPTATPDAVDTPKPEKTKTPEEEALITEGVTVQVLNGTPTAGAENTMADRLEGLGFEVVNTERASKPYDRTTVFWSSEAAQVAAARLAERFDWLAAPKPANLSPSVSLHVVVGADDA